jgi:RNA processing factor Prp31
LIAKAGSLKRLASLSSSTIQILGAEKALFRTLKTGANPPKHGLLFQHPVIHSAPKWQRGKLARAISSKAAIAARVDLYSRNPEASNTLASKLNDRITEIQEKYKAIGIHILEIKERNTGEIGIKIEMGIEILNLRRINSKKDFINQIKSNGLYLQ